MYIWYSTIYFIIFRFSSRKERLKKKMYKRKAQGWEKAIISFSSCALGNVYHYLIFAQGRTRSKLYIALQESSCFKYFLLGAMYLQTHAGTIVIWVCSFETLHSLRLRVREMFWKGKIINTHFSMFI